MGLQTAANGKVYIASTFGAVPANQAAYEALTWLEITQLENLPEFGDNTEEVTFQDLSQGRVSKLKGTRDAGTSDLMFAYDETLYEGSPLTGQYQMLAGSEDDTTNNYYFKLTYNDASTGSPLGTDTTRYFSALVGSFREGGQGANDVVMVSCNLRLNSSVIRVART
jgi:hypothetical protein